MALRKNTAGQWGSRARLCKRREGGSGADFVAKAFFVGARPVEGWQMGGRLPAGRSGKSEERNAGTMRAEKTPFGVTGGSGPSTAAASVGARELEGEAGPRGAGCSPRQGGRGVQVAGR